MLYLNFSVTELEYEIQKSTLLNSYSLRLCMKLIHIYTQEHLNFSMSDQA
jgi:hypothetical protein